VISKLSRSFLGGVAVEEMALMLLQLATARAPILEDFQTSSTALKHRKMLQQPAFSNVY
jgi:hypothetical protein